MSSAAARIAERALPEVLAVVFNAGGWKAVEGFVNAFGGQAIRVPKFKVGEHHPLAVAAGREAADALVENYGMTDALFVPRGGHSLKLMVVRDNLDLSTNALAGKLKCTYRHAVNLRQEALRGTDTPKRPRGRPRAPQDGRQIDIEDLLK